jgi:hypothetical protein
MDLTVVRHRLSPRTHPALRRWMAACLLAVCLHQSSVAAEIVDRVMAVVGGQVITLSDTRAAMELGLVKVPDADQMSAVLRQLIDRELTLVEVRRYIPPDPPTSAVEDRVRDVRARFASQADMETALARSGLNEDRLRDWLRDDWRIQEYLDERFAGAAQPSDDEVDAYLRGHRDELIAETQTEERARDLARNRLTESRRASIVSDWLDGLRRRADIVDLSVSTQE